MVHVKVPEFNLVLVFYDVIKLVLDRPRTEEESVGLKRKTVLSSVYKSSLLIF